MPASTTTVSLDQAQDWARRLLKATPALSSLSAAQTAVATMLGHASWHALTAFYKPSAPAASPSSKSPSGPGELICVVEAGPRQSMEDSMAGYLAAINAKYPGLNAIQVEVLAHETDEMEFGPDELIERARQVEYDKGMGFEDALSEILEECQTRIYAPPGHMMIRVECANGRRAMTVMSAEEYRSG